MSLMPPKVHRDRVATRTDEVRETSTARFTLDQWVRVTALAWALLYAYLLVVAPAPDPDAVVTTAQRLLGWTFEASILAVFVTSFAGRRLAGITMAASGIGGAAMAYLGIDCLLAGHTQVMFYVMTIGGAALVLHALSTLRLRFR